MNHKERYSLEFKNKKIDFIKRHITLCNFCFKSNDSCYACHKVDKGTELANLARKELKFSKKTTCRDIYAGLYKTWKKNL